MSARAKRRPSDTYTRIMVSVKMSLICIDVLPTSVVYVHVIYFRLSVSDYASVCTSAFFRVRSKGGE